MIIPTDPDNRENIEKEKHIPLYAPPVLSHPKNIKKGLISKSTRTFFVRNFLVCVRVSYLEAMT